MATSREKAEELIRCAACDDYIRSRDGFYCPRCKKGLLCSKHRLPGRKECLSCSIDLKLREMNALKHQEKDIRSFVRFTRFLFLVFSIFFVATRFGLAEDVPLLRNHLIAGSIVYLGIGAGFLYGVFSLILLNQRSKIDSLESSISSIEVRR
jgi:hypothetical protein